MTKKQMIAALQAKGVEVSEQNTLAELRALCVENEIDPSEKPSGGEVPAEAEKLKIVFFRVGQEPLRAASGVAAPGTKIRLKEADARLHEERGKGEILGYAN